MRFKFSAKPCLKYQIGDQRQRLASMWMRGKHVPHEQAHPLHTNIHTIGIYIYIYIHCYYYNLEMNVRHIRFCRKEIGLTELTDQL